MSRQYLTIGVNGLVEAAEYLGMRIDDNPEYQHFVEEILGLVERCNKKYRTGEVMFNCEMIPAENVGVKHAKWDREAGYDVPRDCYNSYFYAVEDASLNILDKFRLHGKRYIAHLTGGSALHMNLEEHLSQAQYRQLLRVAAQEGCNYFTFNIPNTVCNDCGHIDKRYLRECPVCRSRNTDYLTRVIGYMKRISNFSLARQQEAARRHYGSAAEAPAADTAAGSPCAQPSGSGPAAGAAGPSNAPTDAFRTGPAAAPAERTAAGRTAATRPEPAAGNAPSAPCTDALAHDAELRTVRTAAPASPNVPTR